MNRKELKYAVSDKLREQILLIRNQIGSLSTDAQNDAKSSAGDKHETGLAMMHIEQEKLNLKLSELIQLQNILQKLPEEKISDKVVLGAIVKTKKAIFYVSIAMPAVLHKNQTIICISPSAPLMQLLLNRKVGEEIAFNNISYEIVEIL